MFERIKRLFQKRQTEYEFRQELHDIEMSLEDAKQALREVDQTDEKAFSEALSTYNHFLMEWNDITSYGVRRKFISFG